MKNKIKTVTNLFFLFVVISGSVLVFLCGCFLEPFEVSYSRWEVELPKEFKMEFTNADTAHNNFHGDGTSISIYKAQNQPVEFISDFIKEKETAFEIFADDHLDYMIRSVKVEYPEDFRPDWDKNYYWRYIGSRNRGDNTDDFYNSERSFYDSCCLLMIFYLDENKLFMIRSLL